MMKYVLASVADDVAAGSTLADSMARHPGTFDRLYSKMIAAGEVGGVLDVILQRLAVFMEKAQALKRRVIGAMIYPVVVIIIAVLIVTGIMYFVIPKFIEIFNDFEVELPGLTIFLTEASAWVAGSATPDQQIPGAAWIVVSPFIIFVLWKIIRKIEIGRKITDRLLLISSSWRLAPQDRRGPVYPDSGHADCRRCPDPRGNHHHQRNQWQQRLRGRAGQGARLDPRRGSRLPSLFANRRWLTNWWST